jgi:hypothetical protein
MTTPIRLLDIVRIASPCTESWERMSGDDRARYCSGCDRKVYNLSAMTRFEAESLLENAEGRVCVRLYRRPDGSVMTEDCPTGSRMIRVRMLRRISTVATTSLALINGVSNLLPERSASALFDDEDRGGNVAPPFVEESDETYVTLGIPVFRHQGDLIPSIGDMELPSRPGNPVPDTTMEEKAGRGRTFVDTRDPLPVDRSESLPDITCLSTFERFPEPPAMIGEEEAADTTTMEHAQLPSVREWPELR